jgi:hypothetical protein
MPDIVDKPKEGEGAPVVAPVVSPDVTALQTTLAGLANQMQSLQTGFNALVADRQAAAARGEPIKLAPRVTDEEINDAYAQGNAAPVLRRLLGEAVEDVVTKHVTPLQQIGVRSISGLTKELTKGQMKYYERFKDEIDKYIDQMDPEARMNPAALKIAHDVVVGQKTDLLVKEAVEAGLRQAAEGAGGKPNLPGSTVKRGEGEGKIPTAEELFGKDSANALLSKGVTEDEFAKSLGHADWPAYVKLYNEQEAALSGGKAA